MNPFLDESVLLNNMAVLSLLLGWLLDKCLGDPMWLPHPIVLFGKMIARGERKLNRGNHRMTKGVLLAITLVLIVFIFTALIHMIFLQISLLVTILFDALCIFFCLSGTTLIREVRQVFVAVDRSPDEGRRQVARIVGRDTSELSAQEVRTAALETLAENLSDGVIAPLFWYLLLGVPGMLAYKMINTLDSMIGYKNERFVLFGRFAARMDDVVNFVPARLTAFLMILVSGRFSLISFVGRYGKQHASPNSGYPEAALAGILNCRFGGPNCYFGKIVDKPYIGTNDRLLTTKDMKVAVRINQWSEAVMIVVILLIRFVVETFIR
ncbi:MAG: adenosylcobinamide-phosphate synthase CbiB [Tannerella sp.]|jgi:adenosylcobinamide-phosphate synthase|nr:adenosylcobinamide-phosphate synthase CbiB [Tannerella sp.]